MEAITLPIYNSEGKEVDSVKLDKGVFDGKINTAAIFMAVNAYRSNQRKGLAATKTRGEVSGGGRKPWKQKGTGRARVGSTRSPLWRHGGVIFGPHPRDFYRQRVCRWYETLALARRAANTWLNVTSPRRFLRLNYHPGPSLEGASPTRPYGQP